MTIKSIIWCESLIPSDLRIALENNLEISERNSKNTNSYITYIKNFRNIKIINKQIYSNLFKILLYIEHFEKSKMKANILKGCKLEKKKSNVFTIFAPILADDDSLVKLKDMILLEEITLNDIYKHFYYAKVVKISKKNIDFVIINNSLLEFNKNKRYNISLIESEWPMRICHYALKQIRCNYLTSLIYPEIGTNRNCSSLDLNWFNASVKKNSEQKQVVINVLNMTAHPAPYILFGPPGTGKTATLVELICQAWKKGSSTNVLVCAPSNAAVDEITKRLLNYLSPKVIYRIYSQSYERSKVDKTILPCSNFLTDNCDTLNKILLSRQIILATIITCGRFVYKTVRKDYFSYIIIDEASQATEPETIIPFLFESKDNNKSQIVLAGDPYQLGPVVVSRIAKPLLGISMLKRLLDRSLYKQNEQNNYDQNYVTKLKRNYRSHECILHVSNQEFYGNELIACGNAETVNRAIGWSTLPNKNFPIIFHSSDGRDIKAKYSYSIYNLEEISIIMKYLQLLMGKKIGGLKIKQKHIGIVSPFKRQKIEIVKRLKQKNWQSITVGTVETFQGCEKEIIILTTVRSRILKHDGIENIGFLSDEKRFNVALTRAKCLLIVIGNPIVLETDKHWKILIEYCRENKAFIESPSVLKEKSRRKRKYRIRRKIKISVKEKVQGGKKKGQGIKNICEIKAKIKNKKEASKRFQF